MATQHPDNALHSPFSNNRFVSTAEEIEECFKCFSELGVHEYMWDWEGKFVDEAVIDRLYQKYTDFFRKNQIGKDVFLTFRVPNIWEEVSHRLPRAFMNILSAEHAAKNFQFHTPPIFEIILPMTTSSDQLVYLQEKFTQIQKATENIFEMKSEIPHIDVIPLFETMDAMFNAKQVLQDYVAYLKKEQKFTPEYLRVFIARSDPAMNTGLIPAMICCKSVIHQCRRFMEETGMKVYPWIGAGSLPFRGGVNPDNIEAVIDEYQGIYSLTIQSAFRSDYSIDKVKQAIAELNIRIPQTWKKYQPIDDAEMEKLQKFAESVIEPFQTTIENIAGYINRVAEKLPNHRERVQHVGLFGYSRGVGKVKLPRAIKFCGAFYSLGVPAEFIGTGRVLKMAKEQGMLPLLESCYKGLRADLIHAGHYLNKENLDLLAQEDSSWEVVKEDIRLVEEYLKIELGPTKVHHMLHRNFTSNIFYKMSLEQDYSEDVLKAAEIRRSLG